jgi:pimeloyl-ACP methyl ester carboxylesterase
MTHALHKSAISDATLPPLGQLWREARALTGVRRHIAAPVVPTQRRGDGLPVMVIPGFLSSDISTAGLRRRLTASGFVSHGWAQGLNMGASEARLDRLAADVSAIARAAGRPVALVGWSLGGLYARETAKRVPDAVARVVTLGSPFSGDPRGNRVWRLYEWVNGHAVDRLPIEVDLAVKPPVHTTALWSRGDGIVAPRCARGLPHESDRAVEVDCSHIGFIFEPDAVAAIIDALADQA